MRSSHESKIAYVYGLLLVIVLVLVILFLLCDLKILSSNICSNFNEIFNSLTEKVNSWLAI